MVLNSIERKSDRRFIAFVFTLYAAFAILVYNVLIFSALGVRLPGHSLIISDLPFLIYGAMAWLGFRELIYAKKDHKILAKRGSRLFINIYFVVLFIMSIQMLYNYLIGGSSFTLCLRDLLVWLLPSIAVFGIREKNWKILLRALFLQTLIACLISIIVIPSAQRDLSSITSYTNRDQTLSDIVGIFGPTGDLLYASYFLLLTFSFQNIRLRMISLFSVALITWVGVIGQFRHVLILTATAAALAWFYIPLRSTILRTKKRILGLMFVLGLLLIFLLTSSTLMNSLTNSNNYIVSSFNESLAGINNRFTGESPGNKLQYDEQMRMQESKEALSEGNIFQIVFGQGFGSTWSGGSLFPEQRNMVHLGFGMLLFRGGIPLFILFMIFPIGIGLYVLIRSHKPLTLACAGLVLLLLISMFVSNIFDLNLAYILALLCAGGCLMHFRDREPYHNHPES